MNPATEYLIRSFRLRVDTIDQNVDQEDPVEVQLELAVDDPAWRPIELSLYSMLSTVSCITTLN